MVVERVSRLRSGCQQDRPLLRRLSWDGDLVRGSPVRGRCVTPPPSGGDACHVGRVTFVVPALPKPSSLTDV